jgi:hypothetical protein
MIYIETMAFFLQSKLKVSLALPILSALFFFCNAYASGPSGISHKSDYYFIWLGSGLRLTPPSPPRGEDPSGYYEKFYKENSEPYREWFDRAKTDIDAVFSDAVKKLSVTGYTEKSDTISLTVSFPDLSDGTEFARFRFNSTSPIKKKDLDRLEAKLKKILLRYRNL